MGGKNSHVFFLLKFEKKCRDKNFEKPFLFFLGGGGSGAK